MEKYRPLLEGTKHGIQAKMPCKDGEYLAIHFFRKRADDITILYLPHNGDGGFALNYHRREQSKSLPYWEVTLSEDTILEELLSDQPSVVKSDLFKEQITPGCDEYKTLNEIYQTVRSMGSRP